MLYTPLSSGVNFIMFELESHNMMTIMHVLRVMLYVPHPFCVKRKGTCPSIVQLYRIRPAFIVRYDIICYISAYHIWFTIIFGPCAHWGKSVVYQIIGKELGKNYRAHELVSHLSHATEKSSPNRGENKHIWNHHLVLIYYLLVPDWKRLAWHASSIQIQNASPWPASIIFRRLRIQCCICVVGHIQSTTHTIAWQQHMYSLLTMEEIRLTT